MYYLTICYCLILTIGSCNTPGDPGTATTLPQSNPDSVHAPIASSTSSQNASEENDSLAAKEIFALPYQLNQPQKSLELPSRLTEISGLAFVKNNSMLVGVQDEKGNLYLINQFDGKIEEKIDFGRDGDYEGVEMIGDNAYVVNSSGTIYEIININVEKPEINKYKTPLKSSNDVEGLTFDSSQHRLLLACKGRPLNGASLDEIRGKKAIYAFDLNKKELLEEPAYIITLSAVQDYLKQNPNHPDIKKLIDQFGPEEKRLAFNPSAIAIHPKTKDLYILSSAGKTILVMDQKGAIKHIERLRKKIHTQPEGIAFAVDGTLYISNEGSGKKAKIHVFYPK